MEYYGKKARFFIYDSKDLAEKIPGAVYCATLEETEQTLRSIARPGDLVLTVGAGELNVVAGRLTADN